MKVLINLFDGPARPAAVMNPMELGPQELAAICDGLQLLNDTRPGWLSPFTLQAKAKIEVIRSAWRKRVREG